MWQQHYFNFRGPSTHITAQAKTKTNVFCITLPRLFIHLSAANSELSATPFWQPFHAPFAFSQGGKRLLPFASNIRGINMHRGMYQHQ